MTKQNDNLNRAIESLRQTSIPQGPSDELIRQTLSQIEQTQSTLPRAEKRSFIMKTTFKFAAAAMVIIGVSLFFLFNSTPTSVAWAQVVEQLNQYERYKCRERVVRENGLQIPTKNIYHLNLSLRRQEAEDGTVQIIDMRAQDAITVELYPDKKSAVVTKLLGFGPKKDPDIIDMVKRFEQQSTEKLGTKEVDGKVLQGFRHLPNPTNDFTVWVDPKTKLPVEIELKHIKKGQLMQTIFMDQFEFDFNLPMSAFSTDIPDGYDVETIIHDYRPFEPQSITPEQLQEKLNHMAYMINKLPWMRQTCMIEAIDPLGTKAKVYLIGIQTDDENVIVIVQGDYYDAERMVWIPKQEMTLETPIGIKLYTHPNGAIYADHFLECLAKAVPGFFDYKKLENRLTRMIVMPNGVVLGLSANKPLSNEKLQEVANSLKQIEPAPQTPPQNQ